MKRFLQLAAAFLAPVLLVTALFYIVLVRTHEITPTETILERSAQGGVSLIGLAYRDDTRSYKHTVAGEVAPEVLVLGTSRSMQFRGQFFDTDSFYNAGGGVAYLTEVQYFLSTLPKEALPKHLLLVLDQYFYNTTWSSVDVGREPAAYTCEQPNRRFALRRAMMDYCDGKYSLLQALQTPDDVYGLSAVGRSAGFYGDGSYSYGAAVEHPEKSSDYLFKDSLSRISLGVSRFEYGDMPDETMLEYTEFLLRWCEQNQIQVTAILPPYAPTVWQAMQDSGHYAYIDGILPALEPLFARYGGEIFNYSFLPETQDAQYIDGFHGSDRVYAVVCARLARDSALMGRYFDADALTALASAEGNPLTVTFPDA